MNLINICFMSSERLTAMMKAYNSSEKQQVVSETL